MKQQLINFPLFNEYLLAVVQAVSVIEDAITNDFLHLVKLKRLMAVMSKHLSFTPIE